METTIVYRDYIGILGYIGIIKGTYLGFIGIMEKRMETTIMGYINGDVLSLIFGTHG